MNKLEKTVVGVVQELDGKFIRMVDLNARLNLGLSLVVIRLLTVKTSLLIQICKTILKDASTKEFILRPSKKWNYMQTGF